MAGKLGGDALAPFAISIVLILVALMIGDPTVGMILGAVVMLLLIYTMTKLPLRVSLMALMFCAFVLENPNDLPASGKWQSPFYMVGAVLLTHLNLTTGISGLSFSGMDVALVTLLLIAWQRKTSGSKIDTAGQLPTPQPLKRLALVSILGTFYVWISGLVRGGEFSVSLWQVDKVIYLPIVFFLFHLALRGPKDHAALAKVLIVGAVIRAALAIYIGSTVQVPPDEEGNTSLPYQTSHHDSMTFAAAVIILLAMVLFKAHKSAPKMALGLLPILLYGMVMNHRRMVWVQIGVVFALLYFLTPMNPAKRKVKKIAWILSPLVLVYVIVGWNAKSSAFKPVQTIRSVIEPATDASSMTREIENYDLIYTIRQYPILGTGYGNGYWEMIPLPPMGYPLERYIPHNSLLGLWVYGGIFGYAAITLLWVGGVYFGLRAYRASKKPDERTAALMSFGAVIIYTVQCWGDMGLGSWIGVFTTAPALVVAGKLAVATGAWPVQQKARKPSAAPATAPAEPSMAPGPIA
jgi:hypothetical protein